MTRPSQAILVFAAALTAALAAETVSAAAQPADACLSVASAKYSQWAAQRMMIQETQTFADGTSRQIEAVFTPDSAYAHIVGQPWMTVNHSRGQRSAAAPARLVRSMGLTDCAVVGSASDGRQPVSIYSYDYVPDENASHVTGKIWVSDRTSLPVRQELNQEMEPGHNHVPVAISAQFSYGDDVRVPAAARRADERRRAWSSEHFTLGAPVGGVGLGMVPTSAGASGGHH